MSNTLKNWVQKVGIMAIMALMVLSPVAQALETNTVDLLTDVSVSKNPYDPTKGTIDFNYKIVNNDSVLKVLVSDSSTFSTSGFVYEVLGATNKPVGTTQSTFPIKWNGKKTNGDYVPNGTYYYKVSAEAVINGVTVGDEKTGSFSVSVSTTPTETKPSFSCIALSENPFDPNNEQTLISYTATNSPTTVTAAIYDTSISTTNPIETLTSTTNSVGGCSKGFYWDGKNSNGNPYPEKAYRYKLTATNSAGTETREGDVTIDYDSVTPTNGTPVITSHYVTKSPFNPDDESTTIVFKVDREAKVKVEILDTSVFTTSTSADVVVKLLDTTKDCTDECRVSWDGYDSDDDQVADDTYTYRITATNKNDSDLKDVEGSQVRVDTDSTDNNNSDDLISNLEVKDATFDPTESERARLYFDVENDDTDITIVIIDEDGDTVRELVDGMNYDESNDNIVTWNGRDDDNDIVDDGDYQFKIKAEKGNDDQVEYEDTTVDTDGNTDNNNNDDDDYGDLIDNVETDVDYFDPKDGEKGKISFDVLEDNVNVKVQILDGSKVLRTLVTKEYDEDDNYGVFWNGRDADNDIVKDDVYRFKITAEKGNKDEVAYRYIEVDTDGIIIGFPDDNGGYCAGFTDVPKSSAYCKAIEYLKLRGVFQGYPDGTFGPNSPINRAETTRVVLLALGVKIMKDDGSNLGFWDVVKNSYYMPYLRTAKAYGIIRGYPDGSFKPGKTVNRVELLRIFLEAVNVSLPYCTSNGFSDTENYAWYNKYVCYAIDNSLMSGDGLNKFYPDQPMTRGEVANLFYNFEMKKLYKYGDYSNYDMNYNYYYSY